MAARTNVQLQMVCCSYEGKKFSVNLTEGMKTRDVIAEAAKTINVRPEQLSALWCGQVIGPDVPLQDVIANRAATDLHLVQLHVEDVKNYTVDKSVDDSLVYVYCKECEGMAEGRQILICSRCNEKNKFIRQTPAPVKMFEVEFKIDGRCINQGCSSKQETITAQVRYECKGCGKSAAVLKHLRSNPNEIPCMKCNNARDIMFVFCCEYLHTVCLICYQGYCQMQMNNSKFQIFDNIGYSVCCPAANCSDSPVRDPHHFYLVNGEKFYKIFQHKAIECYQPMGNNIYCTNCFTEIDIGSSSSDVVAVTKSNAEEQGGLWWSRKTKATKKSSAKKKPLQRRRVTCPTATCGKTYCVECKSYWHDDGDCIEQTEPSKDDVFDIYEPYEKAARWPQQP